MTGSSELLLHIDSLAFGGDGVARRPDGKVVFVPLTVPGDHVAVRIVKEHRRHSRGELTRVVEPAPHRREPPCPLFGRCGGCQWQQMGREAQLDAKRRIFVGCVGHAGPPIVAGQLEMGYRRRVRLHWRRRGGRQALGFMHRGTHRPLDVERCPLLVPALQRGMEVCREALGQVAQGEGTLVLLAGRDGALHVSVRGVAGGAARGLAAALEAGQVFAGGLVGGSVFGEEAVDCGTPDQPLWASAECFVQANAEVDGALRALVAERIEGGDRALELFAGVGNLTGTLQRRMESVVTVEASAASARWLRRNTASARASRPEVVQARADAAVARLLAAGERFELVLLDPPRQGCEAAMLQAVARLRPRRVIYVSCDPMTLARDLAVLGREGLRVEGAQALDMMPQTYHIEGVVSLVVGEGS